VRNLYVPILIAVLFGCNNRYIEVDCNFDDLDRSYQVIMPNGLVQSEEINMNNNLCLLYFFDASCPSCWYKYENVSSYYSNNTKDIQLIFFAFNWQPELIQNRQFENFNLYSPVRLIPKLPYSIKRNTIYLLKNKKVFMMLNTLNNYKDSQEEIKKLFLKNS